MIGKYNVEQAEKLIKLARKAIESVFSGEKIEMPTGKEFRQARGVFVTLTENGKLRGCIGFPYPNLPIAQAVVEAAKSAAFSDFRFSQLKKEELDKIKIEISILSLPEKCKCEDVKVGRDGLMCKFIGYGGLLLPQVATENKMKRIEFIEALCGKAGLPKDAWQKNGFELYKFSAQIFSEENGKIVEKSL